MKWTDVVDRRPSKKRRRSLNSGEPSGQLPHRASATALAPLRAAVRGTDRVAYSETFPSSDGLVFRVNRIRVEPFTPTVGTSFCQAISNSTGAPAAISAVGVALVTSNDVTLRVSGLPSSSFGFFLASRTQASIPQPGGSQGVLCLGGSVGRFVGPGQIRNAGQAGAFELRIDLTSLPQPAGPVAAVTGETWNFTSWYRDSVGGNPTSNFTNGLSVNFH